MTDKLPRAPFARERSIIERALPPGEQLEAVIDNKTERRAGDLTLKAAFANFFRPRAWLGSDPSAGQWLPVLLFGPSRVGSSDSIAGWLLDGEVTDRREEALQVNTHLVFTSDRVISGRIAKSTFIVYRDRPRAVVTGVRAGTQGWLRRSTVLLDCADGSIARLITHHGRDALLAGLGRHGA